MKCSPLFGAAGLHQPHRCCTSQRTGIEFRTDHTGLFKQTSTNMVSEGQTSFMAHPDMNIWSPVTKRDKCLFLYSCIHLYQYHRCLDSGL